MRHQVVSINYQVLLASSLGFVYPWTIQTYTEQSTLGLGGIKIFILSYRPSLILGFTVFLAKQTVLKTQENTIGLLLPEC